MEFLIVVSLLTLEICIPKTGTLASTMITVGFLLSKLLDAKVSCYLRPLLGCGTKVYYQHVGRY